VIKNILLKSRRATSVMSLKPKRKMSALRMNNKNKARDVQRLECIIKTKRKTTVMSALRMNNKNKAQDVSA